MHHRVKKNSVVCVGLCAAFPTFAGPCFHFLLEVMEFLKRATSTGLFNNTWSDGIIVIILTPYTSHYQVSAISPAMSGETEGRGEVERQWGGGSIDE